MECALVCLGCARAVPLDCSWCVSDYPLPFSTALPERLELPRGLHLLDARLVLLELLPQLRQLLTLRLTDLMNHTPTPNPHLRQRSTTVMKTAV